MACVDDVVEEVPDERNENEDVVDAQQSYSASQWLWGFFGGVVKDLQTDGVVEILPVDLANLLVVTRHLRIGLCVFHLNLQIISCYTQLYA